MTMLRVHRLPELCTRHQQGAKSAKASKEWDGEGEAPADADAKAIADAKEVARGAAGAKVGHGGRRDAACLVHSNQISL